MDWSLFPEENNHRVINQQSHPSAVLLPLFQVKEEDHILFQVRAEGIVQGGEICYPGGRFDPIQDRSLKDTAIRETKEELGISPDKIKVRGKLGVMLHSRGFAIHVYYGELAIKSLKDFSPQKNEVARLFSLPLSELSRDKIDQYQVRQLIQSRFTDDRGKDKILLPSEELGLPEIYHGTWGERLRPVYHLTTSEGPLWGITAEILYDFLGFLN